MAEQRNQAQEQSPEKRLEEDGHVYREDADGVQRLVAAPDDERPGKQSERRLVERRGRRAAELAPAGVHNAPQNWDDVSATFEAGKADRHADNAEHLNETQSRATVGHAVEAKGSGIGPASGKLAGVDATKDR